MALVAYLACVCMHSMPHQSLKILTSYQGRIEPLKVVRGMENYRNPDPMVQNGNNKSRDLVVASCAMRQAMQATSIRVTFVTMWPTLNGYVISCRLFPFPDLSAF